MSSRIKDHPILGKQPAGNMVKIIVDGQTIPARKGEMIAAALLANNIIVHRYTVKRKESRGVFCGIGQCTDCVMKVNGKPNVRTCVTPVAEGMIIETQYGVKERGDGE